MPIPTYQRKVLFQTAALLFDPKTWVGTTAGSIGVGGTVFFIDQNQANPAFSGERLYDRAWIYHHNSQTTYRVASFNSASGAFVTQQTAIAAIASGDDFTVMPRLSPQNFNLCFNRTVSRFRSRQEVAINAVDGQYRYQLDNAASGVSVQRVLNAYYYTTGSQAPSPPGYDLGKRYFNWWGDGYTASGTYQLTVDPAVPSGAQVIVDGIVDMTLGAAETATLNIPHDEWVYAGVLMHAYNLLVQQAPGQAAAELLARRAEWARQWREVAGKMSPVIDRSMQGIFDENPTRKSRGSSI